jgi:hypothetical protein
MRGFAMIGYTIFLVSMVISISCISYSGIAQSKGWPVGMLLHKDASFPKIAAFVTALWVLVKSFIIFHWWSPIIILVSGWLIALIFVFTLKKNVQFISIFGVFPSLILTILYISETKPFGILHKIFS